MSDGSFSSIQDTNDVIIRKPPGKFTCPLSVKSSKIYESRLVTPTSKKQSFETETSEKQDEVSVSTSHDWLKPGFSVPKFRSRDYEEVEENVKPPLKEKYHESVEKIWENLIVEDLIQNKVSSVSEKIIDPLPNVPSIDLLCPDITFLNNRTEVDGISECPSTIHLYSSEFNFVLDVSEKPAEDESRALKNWESWMKRRKHLHENLCKKTKRKPTALVMNQAENFREVVEDRTLFQYSQIPEPDKWRGPPCFWNAGDRLHHKNMAQDYHRTQTSEEKGAPRDIEFVRVPDVIKAEKDLLDEHELKKGKKWECSLYRKKRSEELINKRKKYREHKVEGNDLVVVGKKIGATAAEEEEKEKTPDESLSSESSTGLPSIIVSEEIPDKPSAQSLAIAGYMPCCYPINDVDRGSTVCLVINDTELKCLYHKCTSELYMADSCVSEWPLIFETKRIKTLGTATLKVENKGTMAIQYSWTQNKPEINSDKYPNFNTADHTPWFYFDKNSGIFLPGQIYDLNFYHYSRAPGLHVENWILETVPLLFKPPTSIKITLIAVAEQSYTINDLLRIESYVEKCVGETLIKQLLDEIFERAFVPRVKQIDYRSFFLEEELFKYQNPRHHYHYEIVKELKTIYSQIPLYPPQEWDLNLFTLKKLVEEKLENTDRKSALCKISELSRALLRPSHIRTETRSKWHMVFSSLCKVVNLIEEDALYLKSCLLDGASHSDEVFIKSDAFESDSKPTEVELETKTNEMTNISDYQNIQFSARYYQCLYVKVYHHLCDFVEQVVTIVESCKVFENKGEIPLNIFEEQ